MKILSRNRMAAGKFLALDLIEYEDNKGIVRKWESVSRTGCGGAVVIICRLVPSDEIVLVKQFRPPAGNIMLEFPAGLVEEKEDPAVAAVRELEEETGFKGKVKKILPPSNVYTPPRAEIFCFSGKGPVYSCHWLSSATRLRIRICCASGSTGIVFQFAQRNCIILRHNTTSSL